MRKILIITDSRTHQESDDIFQLISKFKKLGHTVFILDREFPENILFFNGTNQKNLWVYNVLDSDFTFKSYKNNNFSKNIIQKTEVDLILLRIDRPISDKVLQFIEEYFFNKLIINSPSGIIETANKEFLFSIEKVCPTMKVCVNYGEVIEFSKFFPIVIKPLKGYGGKDICRILDNKYYYENKEVDEYRFQKTIMNLLKQDNKILAVEYLKNVNLGDKRIYVVNGDIIGAINRVPKHNSWIGNVQQGAIVEKTTICRKEKLIISTINKTLQDKGIYVYGADILIDNKMEPKLSEINTLNVGGCSSIDQLYNSSCMDKVVEAMLRITN